MLGWKPQVAFDDGLPQLVDWFRKEGAVILQAGGAIPSTPIELVLTASLETKIVLARHGDLLPGLLVHHHPQVVAVPPAQQAGRPLLRGDGAHHPAAGRLPRGHEAAAVARTTGCSAKRSPSIPSCAPARSGRSAAPTGSSLSMTQLEALKMVLGKEVAAERDLLGHYIPWLATIGSVSPLLGLLGTTRRHHQRVHRHRHQGLGQPGGGGAGRRGGAGGDVRRPRGRDSRR